MNLVRFSAGALCALAPLSAALALSDSECNSLTSLSLPAITISTAQIVPAAGAVPEYCRVHGHVDTEINFDLGLPTNWNGKLYHAGGGGFVGSIPSIDGGLSRGYASVATDTGHVGNGFAALDGSWALNRLDRQINFGHRAVHVVTVAAKKIIGHAYGSRPRQSYFEGCSNGGRQAMQEAQRYPRDFDGIIAGAPALDWTGLMIGFNWDTQAVAAAPAITPEQLTLIAQAALARCDAQDGLVDGLISKPLHCDFNPSVLRCRAGETANCLTGAQVRAVKKVYSGPINSRGRQLHPGFPPGAEDGGSGWQTWITGPTPFGEPVNGKPLQAVFQDHYLRYFVFSDPAYDSLSFDFDRDPRELRATGRFLNATNTDLSPLHEAGGKLIMWHGWADHALMAERSLQYFEDAADRIGTRKMQRFTRLYFAPGMHHCGGGPGPNTFDMLTALEKWVEDGDAPGSILATKYVNDDPAQGVARTRPLCPHPKVATYKGHGSIDVAASFVCKEPKDHDDDHHHH